MKFKFCSDGDCPLWALAALHALSSLPAPLFKSFLQRAMEAQPDDGIMEILKDTSLCSREECARAAAAVRWVVRQCCSGGCPGSVLTRDLLVLGMPRAHATALADAAEASREAYVTSARDNYCTMSKLTHWSVSPAPEGAVDVLSLSLFSEEVTGDNKKKCELLIDRSQARQLLVELKGAYQKMDMPS